MLTRLIGRADVEYEYRDAEYEYEYEHDEETARTKNCTEGRGASFSPNQCPPRVLGEFNRSLDEDLTHA